MAKRRPRHGQNHPARAYAGVVLVSLLLLVNGLMFIQTFHVTVLKFAVAAATVITITSWQVWRQKRRSTLGAAERPPAEPSGYTLVELPPTENTPPL